MSECEKNAWPFVSSSGADAAEFTSVKKILFGLLDRRFFSELANRTQQTTITFSSTVLFKYAADTDEGPLGSRLKCCRRF